MTITLSKKWADLLERVAATAAEAGIGVAAVDLGHLYPAYAIPIAVAAAALKNVVGHKIGNKTTGSWLPKSADPQTPVTNSAPVIIGG